MTLRRRSGARETSGKEVAPEVAPAEAAPADSDLTADIERRAYEIYLSRNGAPGDPVADWLQAETELRDGETTGRS